LKRFLRGVCNRFCDDSALPLFTHISQVVQERSNLGDLLDRVVKLTAEELELERVMCAVYDPRTGSLVLESSVGTKGQTGVPTIYSMGEGITGRVLETGQAMIIPKVSEEASFLGKTDWGEGQEFSFVCVPVPTRSGNLGTLACGLVYEEEYDLGILERILGIIAAIIAQTVQLYQWETIENKVWKDEKRRLQEQLENKYSIKHMVGKSHAIRDLSRFVEKIAPTQTTVLILGESGVGKELVANAIHYGSPFKDGIFIKFNCGALPESLAESELFGHEKGSFTGAVASRKGLFEEADGGTIFLDEIGDLPLSLQVKLLRVLQEREFSRVGSHKVIKVNVRIVAATHRDLSQMVQEGKFREDLFFRLSTFPLSIPPLRERASDIYLLADHFVEKYAKLHAKTIKRISTPALDMLGSYHWPGNVRELENVIERAVILTDNDTIQGHDLPPSLQSPETRPGEKMGTLQARLDQMEYDILVDALKFHKGNMSKAGEDLGLTKRMMGIRMEKYNLDYKFFRREAK
jgi:Nif-specific regulatory protein